MDFDSFQAALKEVVSKAVRDNPSDPQGAKSQARAAARKLSGFAAFAARLAERHVDSLVDDERHHNNGAIGSGSASAEPGQERVSLIDSDVACAAMRSVLHREYLGKRYLDMDCDHLRRVIEVAGARRDTEELHVRFSTWLLNKGGAANVTEAQADRAWKRIEGQIEQERKSAA